jgi:hypothetical protein
VWLSNGYASRNQQLLNGGWEGGITNGAAWYEITGGLQDYNLAYHSTMEVCAELSDIKWPPYADIPEHWVHNRDSMFWYMMAVHSGIKGIVTNQDGEPLEATIKVEGIDQEYYSDPDFGDYYRLIVPGTYNLVVSREGYETVVVENVEVTFSEDQILNATEVNVTLTQLEDNEAPQVVDVSGLNGALGQDLPLSVVVSEINNVEEVKAIYTINGVTNEIILTQPSKAEYIYSGLIPAQSGLATGTLSIFTKDDQGNEETFDGYTINWLNILIEGFETGDFSAYQWAHQGSENWTIDSDEHSVGVYSAKSGAIGDEEESTLMILFNDVSESEIKFDYKVSSESGYDKLHFYIDDEMMDEWSGEIDWTNVAYNVEEGTHTFKWVYTKDVNTTSGEDCAWIDNITFPMLTIGVDEILTPDRVSLAQNYPNPFNPTTEISFSLPTNSNVNLSIYNGMGQLVKSIVDRDMDSGIHKVHFNGEDLNSGVYFYRLTTNDMTITKKMMLIK